MKCKHFIQNSISQSTSCFAEATHGNYCREHYFLIITAGKVSDNMARVIDEDIFASIIKNKKEVEI